MEICPHARQRMQQRGINQETVDAIIEYADGKAHKGESRIAYTVSHKRANKLEQQGKLSPKLADMVCDKAVLVSNKGGMEQVVTVLHEHRSKRGRGYFR